MFKVQAMEIINQLGGTGKLRAMVGASNIVYDNKKQSVGFKFEGNRVMNHLTIILNSKDLYDLEFKKVGKYDFKTVKEYKDIYCDGLIELFENTTGLYLSL